MPALIASYDINEVPYYSQAILRIRFWNDEDAKFGGSTFEDLLYDDMFRIIEEAGGPVTATDMANALRNGRWANYDSQRFQKHRWSISSFDHVESIAEDLGFSVDRPKHRRTGKPLSRGWAIFI
jgi:hypothetical protein